MPRKKNAATGKSSVQTPWSENSLSKYLAEIGSINPLTRDEEEQLGRDIAKWRQIVRVSGIKVGN